jgi:MFS family permease
MRTLGVMRSALFGAIGFGIGWTVLVLIGGEFARAGGVGNVLVGAIFGGDFSTLLLYMLLLSFVGACGGGVLWLSLRDRKDRRAVPAALLSAVGFFLGSFIVVGLFFFLSFMQVGYTLLEALSAAVMGLVVGALLGMSLRRGRGTVVLALTGLVGFGMGGVVAAALQGSPSQPSGTWLPWQGAVFGVVEGIVGGALLGAALGYLESRKPADERGTTAR